MGYFSNGSEGLDYQERYCWKCAHWNEDIGCPIWLLHELHNNEDGWKKALDKLIPREGVFNGKCITFRRDTGEFATKTPPLRPGQQKALEEWNAQRAAKIHGKPARKVEIHHL